MIQVLDDASYVLKDSTNVLNDFCYGRTFAMFEPTIFGDIFISVASYSNFFT